MDYALYALLLILSLGAIALNVLSIPGNWFMLLAALLLSWFNGWTDPGPYTLITGILVLAFGELLEFLGGLFGARTFGASNAAMWWALVGGIIGALIGVPIPLIGSLIGAVLGAFLGALICELVREQPLKSSLIAATGAAIGRTFGLLAKIVCGIAFWALLLWTAFPG